MQNKINQLIKITIQFKQKNHFYKIHYKKISQTMKIFQI
jgi:hypothetical protein